MKKHIWILIVIKMYEKDSITKQILSSSEDLDMFRNYLLTATRNLLRNRLTSLINISGLALGIAVSLLITIWVQYELDFDSYQEKGDRLCRVITDYSDIGKRACSPGLLGPVAKAELPQIKEFARFRRLRAATVASGSQVFNEDNMLLADFELFDMLSLNLVRGSLYSNKDNLYQALISESIAEKYFGDNDPIGQVLIFDHSMNISVKGVFEDIPVKSHLQFNIALPIQLAEKEEICRIDWNSTNFMTYFELREGTILAAADSALMSVSKKHDCQQIGNGTYFYLQPLSQVHLDTSVGHAWNKQSEIEDMRLIYFFSFVGLAVLLIACFNFTNLSTARSLSRAREIGMRKTVGAGKLQLIGQFTGESFLQAILAGFIAIALIELTLPYFNSFTNKAVAFSLTDWDTILTFTGIVLLTGLIAGIYPAFYLSSFDPVKTLKGGQISQKSKLGLRRVLVVAQFIISITLIVGGIIIYKQITFTSEYTPGYSSENIIHIPFRDNVVTQYERIKTELSNDPDIITVTAKDCLPNTHRNRTSWINWEGNDPENRQVFETTRIDGNYFETMEMEIVAGRNFSDEYSTDPTDGYILNEEAVQLTGLESPIGKRFVHGRQPGTIIGVVNDAHFKSYRQEKQAQVFTLLSDWEQASGRGVVLIKTTGQNNAVTIAVIEKLWYEINLETPFEFGFLDETLATMYKSDRQLSSLVAIFAGLAVLISCLGLFGLISLASQQRSKEFGIRKVLGASSASLVKLMSRELVLLIIIVNLIAWPLTWYLTGQWLEQFAYHVEIGMGVYIIGGLFTLLVALLTTGSRAIKIATSNPVDSLRQE